MRLGSTGIPAASFYTSSTRVGYLNLGGPYLLPSVTVVVVGGTLLMGGIGSYSGTLAGACLLTVLTGLLTAMSLPASGRQIVCGIVVLVMLAAYGRQRSSGQ